MKIYALNLECASLTDLNSNNMNYKIFIPVLSTLVCCTGNPAPLNAHTPSIINGVCDYISGVSNNRKSVNCIVIDEGDGGYTTNIIDTQVHVNIKTNEMYVNGKECLPILAVVNNENPHIYSICGGTDDDYTVVIPTR